jgi:hypothetical protein
MNISSSHGWMERKKAFEAYGACGQRCGGKYCGAAMKVSGSLRESRTESHRKQGNSEYGGPCMSLALASNFDPPNLCLLSS